MTIHSKIVMSPEDMTVLNGGIHRALQAEGDLVYKLVGKLERKHVLIKPEVAIGTTWKGRAGGHGWESKRTVVSFIDEVPGLVGPRAVVTEEYTDPRLCNHSIISALVMTVESIREQLPPMPSTEVVLVEVPI